MIRYLQQHRRRPPASHGMTLVEVVVALAVFAIAILGAISVFIFSLRTVDDSRSFTQATQILNHEMESMRMRAWRDRNLSVRYPIGATTTAPRKLHGLATLGNAAESSTKLTKGAILPGGVVTVAAAEDVTSTFSPFAVYGAAVGAADNEAKVAVVGGTNDYDIKFSGNKLQAQYRNATGTADGYRCTRRVVIFHDGCGYNYATVTLTVEWDDLRKNTHSRSMSSTMSEKGLNSVIYDLSQVQ